MSKSKAMTLRLPVEQAELLETIASVEGRPVSDVIRDAIARYTLHVSKDETFQEALRQRIQRVQGLLR